MLAARRTLLAAVLTLACAVHFARADTAGSNWPQLLHELLPTVVNITVHTEEKAPASGKHVAAAKRPDIKRYFGSGFVIDSSGLILTNYHVVQGAYEIRVTFNDGSVLPAKFLHASRVADLAIVQVQADHPLTAITWGNSMRLQVGDPVVAIGNPLGLGMSVSAGIVSALDRNVQDSPYDDYIQTDAAINHGSSGGPLFDMDGHVVGIDTALVSPTTGSAGLGLAIPSDIARFVVDRLMTYGWVRPGWIGVKVQQVTPDMANAMGLARAEGSVVSWLPPDSPAQKAGMQIGDVILQYNNDTPMNERALLLDIVRTPVGETVPIVVLRDNKLLTLMAVVSVWPRSQWDERDAPVPAEQPEATIPPDLGLTLAAIAPADRVRLGLEDDWKGVLVSRVAPGSDAARHGISSGDVILRVQQQPVALPADVQRAIDAERAAKRGFAALLVLQRQRRMPGPSWMALRLD
jgi:serine protease Do